MKKNKMGKKAVGAELFIYAAGLIIAVVFFAYGIRMIGTLSSSYGAMTVSDLKFRISSDLDSVAGNYGSERLITVNMPKDYNVIIFADFNQDCANLDFPAFSIIKNECDAYKADPLSANVNNIFLAKSGLSDASANMELLPLSFYQKTKLSDTQGYVVIIANNGIAKMHFNNVGSSVDIVPFYP